MFLFTLFRNVSDRMTSQLIQMTSGLKETTPIPSGVFEPYCSTTVVLPTNMSAPRWLTVEVEHVPSLSDGISVS